MTELLSDGDEERHVLVSEATLRRVMREEITSAFTSVGFDMKNPIESQKNLAFLSTIRHLWSEGSMKAVFKIMGLIITASFLAMLVGFGIPLKVLAFIGLK